MKCPCCTKVVRESWYFCSHCGQLLRRKRLSSYDKIICVNCGLMRARHIGLMLRAGACDNFKRSD